MGCWLKRLDVEQEISFTTLMSLRDRPDFPLYLSDAFLALESNLRIEGPIPFVGLALFLIHKEVERFRDLFGELLKLLNDPVLRVG